MRSQIVGLISLALIIFLSNVASSQVFETIETYVERNVKYDEWGFKTSDVYNSKQIPALEKYDDWQMCMDQCQESYSNVPDSENWCRDNLCGENPGKPRPKTWENEVLKALQPLLDEDE